MLSNYPLNQKLYFINPLKTQREKMPLKLSYILNFPIFN